MKLLISLFLFLGFGGSGDAGEEHCDALVVGRRRRPRAARAGRRARTSRSGRRRCRSSRGRARSPAASVLLADDDGLAAGGEHRPRRRRASRRSRRRGCRARCCAAPVSHGHMNSAAVMRGVGDRFGVAAARLDGGRRRASAARRPRSARCRSAAARRSRRALPPRRSRRMQALASAPPPTWTTSRSHAERLSPPISQPSVWPPSTASPFRFPWQVNGSAPPASASSQPVHGRVAGERPSCAGRR